MYASYCCYCEGNSELTGYLEIEHYKPKSLFPELSFDWDNLHYSCSRCNKNKGNKWDENAPILDPVRDFPEQHLYFKEVILDCNKEDERTSNTINHLKLNRIELLNVRTKLLSTVLSIKKSLKKTEIPKTKTNNLLKQIIYQNNDYVSFRNYLEKILLD
jgi:uncharacterized protein (TIGR02646 family)